MKSDVQHVLAVFAAYTAYLIGWAAGGAIKSLISLLYSLYGYMSKAENSGAVGIKDFGGSCSYGKPVKFISNQLLRE